MSDQSSKRGPGLPLGTGAGIFSYFEQCLTVRFGLATLVEFELEDGEHAAAACVHQQQTLENAIDQSAVELREVFSPENVMEFLREHLDRTSVVSVRWLTKVKVDEAGVWCVNPAGEWCEIHVEDIYEPAFSDPSASAKITSELTRSADYAYQRFQLDRRYIHVGRAQVSRSSAEFFGETDS